MYLIVNKLSQQDLRSGTRFCVGRYAYTKTIASTPTAAAGRQLLIPPLALDYYNPLDYSLITQTIVELPEFLRKAQNLLSNEEKLSLINYLAAHTLAGDVMVSANPTTPYKARH